MASLLALLSSILWGTADFFGGKLSKKYQALAVTAVSQAFGLLTGIIIILVSSAWLKPALGWDNYFISGVLAGLFGFVGLIAFYSGLATGRMGVVSPIASLSVLIPLTIAFITGEKPNSTQILGMSIA
ncbi:MAG: EamA/RhaT family transporter, partial [Actinobacteria bacterium]|nr:EamA/RhaT family transporter [Actinomycetota bacterium]